MLQEIFVWVTKRYYNTTTIAEAENKRWHAAEKLVTLKRLAPDVMNAYHDELYTRATLVPRNHEKNRKQCY